MRLVILDNDEIEIVFVLFLNHWIIKHKTAIGLNSLGQLFLVFYEKVNKKHKYPLVFLAQWRISFALHPKPLFLVC